jgi:hypothetical protein
MRLFEFASPRAPQADPAAGEHYLVTSGDNYRGHLDGATGCAVAALVASLLRPADRVLDVAAGCVSPPFAGQFDLVRIAVENFERDVLDSLGPAIARCRPLVVLDVNHWRLDDCQRTPVPDFLAGLRRLFPLLYAVDGAAWHDLHDADGACYVMYSHVAATLRYPLLVGAFDRSRLPRPEKKTKKKTGRTLSSSS